jgi:4-diphosphocytidyl-2-C-methyl-D-erythritol kinase
MHVRRFATHVVGFTPAKINLFLEVLGKRRDGFHELETVLAPISAYDTLVFTPQDNGTIELACRWAMGLAAREVSQRKPTSAARELLFDDLPSGPENLAWKACALLRQRSGIQQGATMELVKRIPAAAGLGGASSDAAAALIAGNLAWDLNWPIDRLLDLAAELGSDVSFFLTRGAAVGRGRGEKLQSIRSSRLHAVVVRPPVGLSTPRVYQHCQPKSVHAGAAGLITALARGQASDVGQHLVNDLQPASSTITPWINALANEFENQNVLGHQMSGSGSSYFGLCRSHRHARRVTARLRARNMGTVVTAATIAN